MNELLQVCGVPWSLQSLLRTAVGGVQQRRLSDRAGPAARRHHDRKTGEGGDGG